MNKIKAGPDAPLRRTFIGSAVKGIDTQAKTIRAYVSTNAWDRYGERFAPDAFKAGMANYEKNPVVLFAHDGSSAPIAKMVSYEFDEKGLIMIMKFANTPKAEEIFALYAGGFMSAFSVGFRPLELAFEERIAGSGELGTVFVRAELFENSAVPVPANPEAVVIKGIGGLTKTLDLAALMGDGFRAEEEPSPASVPGVELPSAPAPEVVPAVGEEPSADPLAGPVVPSEAPKSLKEAVGYLLILGQAVRSNGKIEDAAVRSLLVQAVNLCRELVLGPDSRSLDGVDGDISEEDSALLTELEDLTEKLMASGKATQKDKDELDALAKFIAEKVIGKI